MYGELGFANSDLVFTLAKFLLTCKENANESFGRRF